MCTIYTHIDCTSHILQTVAYKTTTILLEGKRVKLQIWDTSGQGRFCTIIRSYSRGAQGIILVYDITNKWSFDGIDRWLKEVEEVSTPSTPRTHKPVTKEILEAHDSLSTPRSLL